MIGVVDLELDGVKLIQKRAFQDDRGFFSENYREPLYIEKGIETRFVQDNHSYSKKGTIRGMHFQTFPGQAKLVAALVGTIVDVFVDIRKDSPTFGKWGKVVLDAAEHNQVFIPGGFAHGFAVISEEAHVLYKVSTPYDPATEKSFRFDDPSVGIEWPIENPILSERDLNAPPFQEVCR